MQVDRPITIASIFFVVLLVAFFFVAPEYNNFKSLRTELGQKRAEFNAQHEYYASIDRTYFDLQSRVDDVKKVDDALPQDPAMGRLVYSLQKYASESGLIVRDMAVSKAASRNNQALSNNVKEIIFSMDLMGNYSSLGNFIVSLEKSSRIFDITNISFSSAQGSTLGNFSVQVKTYSY